MAVIDSIWAWPAAIYHMSHLNRALIHLDLGCSGVRGRQLLPSGRVGDIWLVISE